MTRDRASADDLLQRTYAELGANAAPARG